MKQEFWTGKREDRQYETREGYRLIQFQGELFPKWGIWEPNKDVLTEEHILWAWTLREARELATEIA